MFKNLREKLGNWTKKITEKQKEESPSLEEISKIKEKEKPSKESKKQDKKKTQKPEISNENAKKEIETQIEKQFQQEEKTEKKSFFETFKSRINKIKISEEDFEEYQDELELILIENNVALEVIDKIIGKLKEKIISVELSKKEIENEIKDVFREIIEESLNSEEQVDLIKNIKEKSQNSGEPFIILFCGINGTGKTTTIGKFGALLKKNNLTCVFAAADTFRAASIEQIKKHGENLDIPVISGNYGTDPAAVGFDAINYAKKKKLNCVLIDTAGRMHTNQNLLKEIEKISRVCKPDFKIFVGESITGNDSVEQVKAFNNIIKIDGIILTKADIDEKGGTALSLSYTTKKPVLYLGTGQDYKNLELFDKNKFIEKLGF